MKALNLFLFLMAISSASIADIAYIDDGGIHTINDIYTGDSLWLDFNEPGTHVNLVSFGWVAELVLFNNSTAIVNNGSLGRLIAVDEAQAVINSGCISEELTANSNSKIWLSGGSIGTEFIIARDGTIYVEGSDFEITDLTGNVTRLSNGNTLSDYATLVEWRPTGSVWDYYSGRVTGTLKDGSILNNSFRIYKFGEYAGMGDIIVIPEPATMLLLSVGGVTLRRNKKKGHERLKEC